MKKILLLAAGALLASSASAATWAVVGAYTNPSWNFEASTVLEGSGNELSCTIDHLISGFKIVDIAENNWDFEYGTSTPVEVGETYTLTGRNGEDGAPNIEFPEGVLAIDNAVVTWNPTTYEMSITGDVVEGNPIFYVTGSFCDWNDPGTGNSVECYEEDGVYTAYVNLGYSGYVEFKLAGEGWSNEIAGGVLVAHTPTTVTNGGGNLKTYLKGEQTLVFDYNEMKMYFEGEDADVIYLVGEPQNWKIDSAAMTLANVEDKVYSGTFNIAQGKAMFRFYTALGDWDTNSIGYMVDDNPTDITLTDGVYTGSCVEGKGSWNIPAWEGGVLTMTVDLDNMTVSFVEPAYMTVEPTITPEEGKSFFNSYTVADVEISWDEEVTPTDDPIIVYLAYENEDPQAITAYLQTGGEFDETLEEFVPGPPYSLIISWSQYTSNPDWSTKVGKYTITVPAGVVKDANGDVNEEIELSYNVVTTKGEVDIVPDPYEMDENWNPIPHMASELSAVTINFDYDLTEVEDAPEVTLVLQSNGNDDDDWGGIAPWANEITSSGTLDPSLVKVEGKSIILDLSGLGNGEWYIEVPAGMAQINETTYTGEVQINYVVKNDLGTPEVIGGLENYASYATVNAPMYALLTWDYAEIELTNEATVMVEIEDRVTGETTQIPVPVEDVVLRNAVPEQEGGEPDPLTRAEADEDEVYNALEINFGEGFWDKVKNTSYVTVSIPEGIVTNGQLMNPAYDIIFDLYATFEVEPNIVNNDGEVTITFPGYGVAVNYDHYYEDGAYVSDSEGNVIDLTYGEYFFDDGTADVIEIMEDVEVDGDVYPDYVGILVRLNNLDLEDGTYTLSLPVGYLDIHTIDYSKLWLSDYIYWIFEVEDGVIVGQTSAIDSINTNNVIEGVYNLQGVKMSNDLNTLAPGLYIINGKKVLIRK